MATTTYDINTSAETIDGTQPGQTFRPLRYVTGANAVRCSLWSSLSTIAGTLPFDLDDGLEIEAILDPSTSDAERSALVGDVVLDFPDVTGISDGPTVVIIDGELISITLTAETVYGPVSLVV